ncbi:MAG: maleylacetate reductase [Gammaproteobacteria bacterium]|jgi:maleylacetate reductase
MTEYTHFPQERVYFGEPFDEALMREVDRHGERRVFLLASASLTANTDCVAQLQRVLGSRYAGVATGMPSHTPRESVLEMAAAARDADADLIVTFGGGSLTDAGKMVRLCLQHNISEHEGFEPFRVVIDANGRTYRPQYAAPCVAQVTIPTTLSAGEFGIAAGCTDSRAHEKQSYRHEALIPQAVILNPEVTVHTPQWLWLSTGMRAVDHCVETICSPQSNDQSDGAALNGLRLLADGLPRCMDDPEDLESRLKCQIGAWQSMEHNQSGVSMGASHGIGHVLGGTCNVPHGHTSCVMLPATLRWNVSVNAQRQALVSAAMGHPGVPAGDVIEDFVASLGQPTRLSAVGVSEEHFGEVARHAMHDRYIHTNPRPITSAEDIIQILELAR